MTDTTKPKVLRSFYIEPDLDNQLAARASGEGITKGELVRRFIAEGLARPASGFAGYAKIDPFELPPDWQSEYLEWSSAAMQGAVAHPMALGTGPVVVGEIHGVAAIFGQWPGDETDEELAAALKDQAAFRSAVKDAIDEHHRAGRCVVVERDGKLENVCPDPFKILKERDPG